jgi:hypothetical protein
VEIAWQIRNHPIWTGIRRRFDGRMKMAAGGFPIRTPTAAIGSEVPFAGRCQPFPDARFHRAPIRTRFWRRWTPETLKGWACSVTLHVVVLLGLGYCYFAPRVLTTIAIETGLAELSADEPHGEKLAGASNALLPTPGDGTDMIGPPSKLPARLEVSLVRHAGILPESHSVNLAQAPADVAPREPASGPRRKSDSRAGDGGPAPALGRPGSGRDASAFAAVSSRSEILSSH